MSVFRRANSQQPGPVGPASAGAISRFSRLIGRLLLWGCVLLLLVRGIASYLNDEPRPASRPRVTAMPRVEPAAPNGKGR